MNKEVVPVLTEVLQIQAGDDPAPPLPMMDKAVLDPRPAEAGFSAMAVSVVSMGAAKAADEALVQRVLVDVQRQIDLSIEHQLGEALGPILRKVADTLVVEARSALAVSLHQLVERAVRQELGRLREEGASGLSAGEVAPEAPRQTPD